jgi:hypothetical protein
VQVDRVRGCIPHGRRDGVDGLNTHGLHQACSRHTVRVAPKSHGLGGVALRASSIHPARRRPIRGVGLHFQCI